MRATVHAERVDEGRNGTRVRKTEEAEWRGGGRGGTWGQWVTCPILHSSPPSPTHSQGSISLSLFVQLLPAPLGALGNFLGGVVGGSRGEGSLRAAQSATPGMAEGVAGTHVALPHSFTFCHAGGMEETNIVTGLGKVQEGTEWGSWALVGSLSPLVCKPFLHPQLCPSCLWPLCLASG